MYSSFSEFRIGGMEILEKLTFHLLVDLVYIADTQPLFSINFKFFIDVFPRFNEVDNKIKSNAKELS